MTDDEIRQAFNDLRPAFQVVRKDLQRWLRDCAARLRTKEFSISGRVKKTGSMLRKVLKNPGDYQEPMREIPDKVGVRIDVLYAPDATRLVEAIKEETEAFRLLKPPDVKIESLGHDQLGYLGIHCDVLPSALPDGLPEEFAGCEIQVRTFAQAAWAMASHDLVYKLEMEVPAPIKRQVHRLMALVELFDDEVGRARSAIVTQPGYPTARVIDLLEGHLVKFAAPSRDAELSQIVVSALLDAFAEDEIEALDHDLNAWIEDRAPKLGEIYERYSDDGRHPILHQPEALLVFHELDRGPARRDRLEARVANRAARFVPRWTCPRVGSATLGLRITSAGRPSCSMPPDEVRDRYDPDRSPSARRLAAHKSRTFRLAAFDQDLLGRALPPMSANVYTLR